MTLTKPIKVMAVLLLFTGTNVSFADEKDDMDGRTLQSLCSQYLEATLKGKISEDNTEPYMRCANYMQGVAETATFYERIMYTVSGNHVFCFPKRYISPTEVILVTNQYIKKNPDKIDSKGVVLVMAAFFEAYSCSK